MKVKYVGPFDEVEIVATGGVVKQGDVVDVPAAVAGRAPSTSKDDDGSDVVDPGEGLLAQPDNWKPAPAKSAAEPKKES